MANTQEGDVILCTVTGIDGTTVFVKTEDGLSGTINFSEIAPGRIRNIRDYVVPNKKIACKALRVSLNNIDFSLRRVTAKERDEVLDAYKQEQTARSAINSIAKEKANEIKEKILSEFPTLSAFLVKAKEDDTILSKYFNKEAEEQIKKIIQKRKKEVEVKKIVKIKCLENDGVKRIKSVLENTNPKLEITYISAGNIQLKAKEEDYKKANQIINEFSEAISKKAKTLNCEISIEEKK